MNNEFLAECFDCGQKFLVPNKEAAVIFACASCQSAEDARWKAEDDAIENATLSFEQICALINEANEEWEYDLSGSFLGDGPLPL